MKASRFTDRQIMAILKQNEGGVSGVIHFLRRLLTSDYFK
jgi:hypothetical protein